MTDIITSIVSVVIGVVVAFILTGLNNYWIQRNLRKKYSKVFSFELEQLKHDLDHAISRYDSAVFQLEELQLPDGIDIDDLENGPDIENPNDILQNYDFKSKYTFLNKNFEKISIFREDTIKSIIKINSLMEEYNILSKEPEKFVSLSNLREIQKEIQLTLELLKSE